MTAESVVCGFHKDAAVSREFVADVVWFQRKFRNRLKSVLLGLLSTTPIDDNLT